MLTIRDFAIEAKVGKPSIGQAEMNFLDQAPL